MALYFQILHERLLHQHSSEHLGLAKSRAAASLLLPCTHAAQQALLATFPAATRGKKYIIP